MTHDYFEPITIPHAPSSAFSEHAMIADSLRLARFVEAYRLHGHRVARLDPLALLPPPVVPELTPQFHGLDPQERNGAQTLFSSALMVDALKRQLMGAYCGAIGLDCSGMRDEQRRNWLFARMEADALVQPPSEEVRRKRLRTLLAAEMWERYAAAQVGDAKRFSLEGCESLVLAFEALVEQAGRQGIRRMFVGMPHRGRINVLANIMGFNAGALLACLDHRTEIAALQRDLPYHLGGIARRYTPHGEVSLFLAHNPSHLQSVYPVVSGMARAWQDEHPHAPCLTVVVHGDAAFSGQGVVMETLNLTRKRGYELGGTIHIILNNQIGFTTPNRMNVYANEYCTNVARIVDAPIIRVNADEPDDVVRAITIAMADRMRHSADVVIDLIGYRRLGHSEHDVPALTHPLVQAAINAHPTVTENYHRRSGEQRPLADLRAEALRDLETRASCIGSLPAATVTACAALERPRTVSLARLRALTNAVTTVPAGFAPHSLIEKLLENWRGFVTDENRRVDWCFAETMAYATLLEEGKGIRISGMDVGRGTFMHRHAVWHSQENGRASADIHIPLRHVGAQQAQFDIVDSPLTEEAVLGFEYGYSVESKTRLVVWEAQFGDFVNGAQVIIDQYIAAGACKWGYGSGLIVLLPHGHEGVGPEHSNGYLGRFLQLCADENQCVAVPTTSAQWFHLLRRQAQLDHPKPLIVMSPKTELLGNGRSHAPLRELIGGGFAPVLRDEAIAMGEAGRASVTRVVLVAGKFFYELQAARESSRRADTALVRIEQLYPFPRAELVDALAEFPQLAEVVWVQEEDANQGAWRSLREELERSVPKGCRLRAVCRTATAAGAHSAIRTHREEQRRLVTAAFA